MNEIGLLSLYDGAERGCSWSKYQIDIKDGNPFKTDGELPWKIVKMTLF
jgi:hypothetical protein